MNINIKKRIILFGICLFVIVTMGISSPAMATLPPWIGGTICGASINSVSGSAPSIDGAISLSEWEDAQGCNINFLRGDDLALIPGHLRFKHDDTNLYILLIVDIPFESIHEHTISFDNNGDGISAIGDDRLYWYGNATSGSFVDSFLSDTIEGTDSDDTTDGGTLNGSAEQGIDSTDGYTFIEFSHPLVSIDSAHDFSLGWGSTTSFNIYIFYQDSGSATTHNLDYPTDGVNEQLMILSAPLDPCAGLGGDTDWDTICDDVDNCPDEINPGQEDDDADGIGNLCDPCTDIDGDGIGNDDYLPFNTCGNDTCLNDYNPGQFQSLDYDGDGIPDACDNCPYVSNPGQEDDDSDRIGNACEEYKISSTLTSSTGTISAPAGAPLWDDIIIKNDGTSAITIIRPDCFNTRTWWTTGGNLVVPIDRHGKSYDIPRDLITLAAKANPPNPASEYCFKCDLSKTVHPDNLIPGTYKVDHWYANWYQDPWYDFATSSCTPPSYDSTSPCYPNVWIGWMRTGQKDVIITPKVEVVEAKISFNPNTWDVAWATENSPLISAKIEIPGYLANQVLPDSIFLNGEVGITGTPVPNGDTLYVQFDRSKAVKSLLNSAVPRAGLFATVQGVLDNSEVFSGEGAVDIVANTGTESTFSHLHTVGGCGSHEGSSKEPIVGMTINVYDRSPGSCVAGIGTNWKFWETIYGDGTGGTSGSCRPLYSTETFLQGEAIFFLPAGSYLMIGKSIPPGDVSPPHSDYIGRLVDVSAGIDDYQYFQVIKKCDNTTVAAKSKKFTGSELLVIEPEYVEWSSTTELYPFVFDSVGDWTVTTSVTPPEGFVADSASLSAQVTNEVEAVQFTITDVGSKWVPTQTIHKLKHGKKKEITFKSEVGIKLTPELAQQKGTTIYGDDQGEDNDDQGKGKKK